jgi:hypothetical protein
MSTYQSPLVVGVFQKVTDAQSAIEDLRNSGFDKSQIGLASQEAGNVTTNLVNELANLGVARDQANFYDNEYKQGRPVVSVRPDGRNQDAVNILGRHGGKTDIGGSGTAANPPGSSNVNNPNVTGSNINNPDPSSTSFTNNPGSQMGNPG